MASDEIQVRYVMDASCWISIEGHPRVNRILGLIADLITAGRLECPREAWDEVERCPWVQAVIGQYEGQMLRSHRQEVNYLLLVGELASKYPRMCGTRGIKEKGDGYVVANAIFGGRISNPMRFVVVANESASKRKIPAACKEYGVECLTLVQMLAREFPDDGW